MHSIISVLVVVGKVMEGPPFNIDVIMQCSFVLDSLIKCHVFFNRLYVDFLFTQQLNQHGTTQPLPIGENYTPNLLAAVNYSVRSCLSVLN